MTVEAWPAAASRRPCCNSSGALHNDRALASHLERGVMERSRLLLVAANTNFRRTLGRLLGRSGYEVTEASSAEQALEVLAAEPFHALLIEMTLPGMSGLKLLCRIREEGLTLPAVLLTEEETTRLRCVLEGVPHAQCVRVPVDPGVLKSALARCVATGQSRS